MLGFFMTTSGRLRPQGRRRGGAWGARHACAAAAPAPVPVPPAARPARADVIACNLGTWTSPPPLPARPGPAPLRGPAVPPRRGRASVAGAAPTPRCPVPRLRTNWSPVREELKPHPAQVTQTRAFRKRLHLTAGMSQLFQKWALERRGGGIPVALGKACVLCNVTAALLPTLRQARGILIHAGICWAWGCPRFLSCGQVSVVWLAPCRSRAPHRTRSGPGPLRHSAARPRDGGTRVDRWPRHPHASHRSVRVGSAALMFLPEWTRTPKSQYATREKVAILIVLVGNGRDLITPTWFFFLLLLLL